MITEVPPDNPESTALVAPIVATDVLLLVQVPPPDKSLSVDADPAHREVTPVMPAGNGLTVTTVDIIHPLEVIV